MFQILYYLLGRGQATACELAEKFEVSTRTIYRDIDKLSSAGIPVYTTTGHGGGVQLVENFVLKQALLSKEDMQNILIGVQSLSAACLPEADAVIAKLQAIFQMQTSNWIEVDYSRWGCRAEREKSSFELLKKAIQDRYQIQFQYYNSTGEFSERGCYPLKLIYKDKAWYLSAFCLKRKGIRLFRISRMRKLELTDQHFEEILREEQPSSSKPPENHLMEMELSFSKEMAYRVYDSFDEDVITQSGEKLIVKVAMPEDEWLYGFLMSFGDKLTVLDPPYLKEELKKRFKMALNHLK
ncbi:MAG: YafY family protein [Bacillota bacterium]|nr:YafY family protein [Bacillota bacterium]